MFDQQAFHLLKNTLNEARSLSLAYFPDWDRDISLIDGGLRRHLENSERHYEVWRELLRTLPQHTILSLRDQMMLNYVLFRGDEARDFFCVGPFRTLPFEEEDLLLLYQRNRLSQADGKELRALIRMVPWSVSTAEALAVARNLINAFYGVEDPKIIDRTDLFDQEAAAVPVEDSERRARQMEAGYEASRRLAAAISCGNYENAVKLAQGFLHRNFKHEQMDYVSSSRAHIYAANTTFRLAAGDVGVPPLLLDEISGSFARRLHCSSTLTQLDHIYMEMVSTYCHICAEHACRQYSGRTRQIMNYISFHLNDALSPGIIARAVNFSPGYISHAFREEVGMSLMAFVAEKRVITAKRLFRTTHMSIREAASYVGIPDWNYFTKLFKKIAGCTPSEYQKRLAD